MVYRVEDVDDIEGGANKFSVTRTVPSRTPELGIKSGLLFTVVLKRNWCLYSFNSDFERLMWYFPKPVMNVSSKSPKREIVAARILYF